MQMNVEIKPCQTKSCSYAETENDEKDRKRNERLAIKTGHLYNYHLK